MKRLVKRFIISFAYSDKGFTLVELLVVVAILGILSASVVLNVSGALNRAKTSAAIAELSNVQTAMDAMMTDQGVTAVTATAATNDMSAFPSAPKALFPDHIRTTPTHGTYSCGVNGVVTQITYP